MLTEQELELAERKDYNFMDTFSSKYANVSKNEMMLSKSNSKFVNGNCWRRTITINNRHLVTIICFTIMTLFSTKLAIFHHQNDREKSTRRDSNLDDSLKYI